MTSPRGPLRQPTRIREKCPPDVNDTVTVLGSNLVSVGKNPGAGRIARICVPERPTWALTSPPCTRSVRRYAVPPIPSGTGCHRGSEVGGGGPAGRVVLGGGRVVGGRLGAGFAEGVGGALVLGGFDVAGALVGAARRRSAADSGSGRLGAAASSTERIPSQEPLTVTAVASIQAIG